MILKNMNLYYSTATKRQLPAASILKIPLLGKEGGCACTAVSSPVDGVTETLCDVKRDIDEKEKGATIENAMDLTIVTMESLS